MKRLRLSHLNLVLSMIAVGLCVYLIVAPFLPSATFVLKNDPPLAKNPDIPPEAIPEENTLVISKMKLQETIHEGATTDALNKGVWHVPESSSPTVGGNTVLTGHRFTYGGPAVFYHMDKIEKGDQVVLYWEKQKYVYIVDTVQVVPPTSSEVLHQTSEPTLTIYTCTPLITAKNRMVIQAKLVTGTETEEHL